MPASRESVAERDITARRDKHEKSVDSKINKIQTTMHSTVASRIAKGKSMMDKKVSDTMKQLCNEATQKAVTQFAA